jgi:putative peptidoglycan lipid II flippase
MIFSISGLVMAGLQAHQHFITPAIAPLVYDLGQIFGALILAPEEGLQIAGIKLPAFGMGIDGLVYGVIIGAVLHLLVQVPGLVKQKFKWSPILDFKDRDFFNVLKLMGPRLISMVFIQLIFLARDNLASRLMTGSVTALSYGWWIQQVPETLIGTAIATALLPTLSEQVAEKNQENFKFTVERSLRVMIALSLPITVIISFASLPWIQRAFGFPIDDAQMILYATRGYMVGLLGHCVVELGVRSFYARKNALIPMLVSAVGFVLYLGFAILLMNPFASKGIALANSISYSIQALVLIFLLNRRLAEHFRLGKVVFRSILSAIISGLCVWLIYSALPIPLDDLYLSGGAILVGSIAAIFPIWNDLKLLVRL